MIDFSNTQLKKLIIHRVGNKLRDEKNFVSQNEVEIDDTINDMLIKYACKPFIKYSETFHFVHNIDIAYNEMNGLAKTIFENVDTFHQNSIDILEHLYEQSNHPHIKTGDVFVCLFTGVNFNNNALSAIGIFKSETKDAFIKLSEQEDNISISKENGISIKKIDKGCLILNTDQADGHRVLSIDNNNYDADYWKHIFLSIDFLKDDNYETKNYINLCKTYAKEVIAKEEGKKEQIDFLNQAVDFFDNNERIDTNKFAETVLKDNKDISKFNSYKEKYETENEMSFANDFDVSQEVLKKQKRTIKKLIKLDTNIQIKLDIKDPKDSQMYVEKGFDEEKKMYFYKVFFNNEIN